MWLPCGFFRHGNGGRSGNGLLLRQGGATFLLDRRLGSLLFAFLTRQRLQFRLLHIPDDWDRAYAAFDDDIRRAADHDQMLDIVAAHQYQTAARIHGRCVENLQTRLPVAPASNEWGRTAASAHKPQRNRQNEQGHAHTNNGDDETVSIGADKIFHHGDHPFRFSGFLISWAINIAVVLIL
ncbi:hypothetical protein D3C86_1506130 [compost metagenome]